MIKVVRDKTAFPEDYSYTKKKSKAHVDGYEVLAEQSQMKCCYCETYYIKGEIEHFRPKSKYPWLEDAYENLLYACHDCNNIKGAKLPVTEIKASSIDSVEDCNRLEELIAQSPAEGKEGDWEILFDPATGQLISNNPLVQKTFDLCGFSDPKRSNLLEHRLAKYQELEDAINSEKLKMKNGLPFDFNGVIQKYLINPIKSRGEKDDFIAMRKDIVALR